MSSTHINPIIPGFAPDPSICFVKDTFYLVNSSFHFFPGIPIYASKDLVEWKIIGNAINRDTQLSVVNTGVRVCPQKSGVHLLAAGGIHAPTIRFHNDTFYIVCTNVTHVDDPDRSLTFGNFVITTKDIWADEWSDPVYFELHGFDPDLFFDDTDGKVYILGTEEPGPDLKIIMYEIDIATGRQLSGKKVVYTGVSKYYPEGPHIYKKDGWYYLLIAEGGTHMRHSVNIARSRDIWGPYDSCGDNPILTALGSNEYIQHVGHADLVRDGTGNWWAVCLGVRRTGERYVLGRETFLTTCTWPEGEWPTLVQTRLDLAAGTNFPQSQSPFPHFKSKTADFLFIREPNHTAIRLGEDGCEILVASRPADFSSVKGGIAYVGKRQRKLEGVASTTMGIAVGSPNASVKAGLAYYKDEIRYARIYKDFSSSEIVTEVVNSLRSINRISKHKVKVGGTVEFRLTYTELAYEFAFRLQEADKDWTPVTQFDSLEMTEYDFTGPVIGVFALGAPDDVQIQFKGLEVD